MSNNQSIVLLPGEKIPAIFNNPQTQINAQSIKINTETFDLESRKGGIFQIKDIQLSKNKKKQEIQKQNPNQILQEISVYSTQQKYYPVVEDFIIGIVSQKQGEFYTLNIGASQEAVLGSLEFEGATKKNKPNLEPGQLVYCRVIGINKYLRPRCSCVNPKSKKEWVSGETLFGQLKGGVQFQINIDKSQNLKDLDFILKEMQKIVQFEIAIGKNGRVWVNCHKEGNTTIFINAFKTAMNLTYEQIPKFINGVQHLFIK
ncbi:Nucleic acid-binding, OB-fold [Pseudocohnilembus persalinus]|uniref:Nucleic acid-binding, OB-fold n=1 Tax=Pseudocohnilembus persalinus TaxID=266149 RepID=A0A0V0QCL4_PSEPJ|nr:Nucleic acid-binding, OB-fold [Pseudocohnilembus persalinus]|eukprot:KRW99944.1 Nucleic acid-binding, OB-fold [Pseudocohnilembus persalinus]